MLNRVQKPLNRLIEFVVFSFRRIFQFEMDTKEATILSDTVSPLFKSTTSLTQIISNEILKIAQLTEYCKMAEEYLIEGENKIQMLTLDKNENEKIKTEYLTKNKINSNNSESLTQVKNELYKYKCELKSNYITTQRTLRSRRLKYQKLISSYESEWQSTLERYNANPLVLELVQIQEENILLEKDIEKLEKIINLTQTEFVEMLQNLKQNFFHEVVEFSKATIEYNKILDFHNQKIKEKSCLKTQAESSSNNTFSICRTEIPELKITNVFSNESSETSNCLSSIDVTVFDDVVVPVENLEVQTDDDLLPFFENQWKDENMEDKNPPEEMEVDCQESNQEIKTTDQLPLEETANQSVKPSTSATESQYFKQKREKSEQSEPWMNAQEVFPKSGNKEFDENQQMEKLKPNGIEEECGREIQTAKETFRVENEENSSDGSFENQYGFQNKPLDNKQLAPRDYNENFECGYNKNMSASSDDNSQHANESDEFIGQAQDKQSGGFLKKSEPEKNFKSFGGFFNTESETNSPKPSIFKLF